MLICTCHLYANHLLMLHHSITVTITDLCYHCRYHSAVSQLLIAGRTISFAGQRMMVVRASFLARDQLFDHFGPKSLSRATPNSPARFAPKNTEDSVRNFRDSRTLEMA